MFLDFYKLREQPFGVTPDPRFLYLSPGHGEALATLIYAVECNRGFSALIATPGMGKTTLLFTLLEHFRSSARTAFLFHTKCNAADFFRHMVSDLEIEANSHDFVEMHQQLNRMLAAESQRNRRVLVIIDEAQDLSDDVLESVRLLSNFETPEGKLIHFLLAGQPALAERLAHPSLAQLRQRISAIARIKPLLPHETSLYIDHRLAVAGCAKGEIFNSEARALIATASGGIPRNINTLCFNALLLGLASQQQIINGPIVREVAADLDLGSLALEQPNFEPPATNFIQKRVLKSDHRTNTLGLSPALVSKESTPKREALKHWGLTAGLCSVALAVAVWAMPGAGRGTILGHQPAHQRFAAVAKSMPQPLTSAAPAEPSQVSDKLNANHQPLDTRSLSTAENAHPTQKKTTSPKSRHTRQFASGRGIGMTLFEGTSALQPGGWFGLFSSRQPIATSTLTPAQSFPAAAGQYRNTNLAARFAIVGRSSNSTQALFRYTTKCGVNLFNIASALCSSASKQLSLLPDQTREPRTLIFHPEATRPTNSAPLSTSAPARSKQPIITNESIAERKANGKRGAA